MSPSQTPESTQPHCPTCRTESAAALGQVEERLRVIDEKVDTLVDLLSELIAELDADEVPEDD